MFSSPFILFMIMLYYSKMLGRSIYHIVCNDITKKTDALWRDIPAAILPSQNLPLFNQPHMLQDLPVPHD